MGSHKPLSDLFELHFIEMQKLSKPLTELRSNLDRWVTFLNRAYEYEKNNIPAELADDEQIKKAIENLDVMHLSGKEREYYENDLKKMLIDKDTLQTAKLKGREEGAQQNKIDIALKMLAAGSPVEFISQITSLSLDEVRKLQN